MSLVRSAALLALLAGLALLVVVLFTKGVQQANSWASVVSVGVAITGAVVAIVTSGRPTLSVSSEQLTQGTLITEQSELLNQAVNDLADAVRLQWTQEASLRSLRRPEPIPIRWSITDRPVAACQAQTAALNEDVVPDADHVVELFRKLWNQQLVFLGDAGAGKTALALLFTLDLLDTRLPDEPVPILLAASSWNPCTEHLHDWLARRILEDYPALANHNVYGPDAARRMVAQGRIMVVLDGLDEIPAALLPQAIDALDAAVTNKHSLMVTCRGEDYQAAVGRSGTILTRAAVLEIDPVKLADAATFLMAAGPSANNRWRSVVDHLRLHPDVPLARVLASPLMISLARTAYAVPTSDPAELLDATRFPDQAAVEHHLLEDFIPSAYHNAPTAPGTPSTSAQRRYPPEQARQWLTFLARHLDTLGTKDLAWWQLVDTIPRPTRGISVGLAAGLVFWFVGFLGHAGVANPTHRLAASLTFGLAFGLATGLAHGLNNQPEPLRVETRFRGTLVAFFRRFVPGLVIGVAVGLGMGLPYQGALAAGLALGFALAVSVWLDIPADMAHVASPRVVLKQDRTATFSFGLVVALSTGLGGGLGNGLTSGLAFGFIDGHKAALAGAFMGAIAGGVLGDRVYGRVGRYMFLITGAVLGFLQFIPPNTVSQTILGLVAYGITGGLACGCVGMLSRAWGAYAVSRIWLAMRGDQPWQLVRFLDDAHRRGVLRQSGATYQFRHARVQDHLAHANTVSLHPGQP